MSKARIARSDKRKFDQLRTVKMETNVNIYAEGSVLIGMGNTRVICTASIEEKLPPFLRDSGRGWITAEYSMLPRATSSRVKREVSRGRPGGRTMEIQRLIGRALRSVVKMEELGERTIVVDCDVIQADGGTRTASITGGFAALCLALDRLKEAGKLETIPLKDYLAAVSVGLVDDEPLLDLDYREDSRAGTDMNVVMTGKGKYVEVQGTAEEDPFEPEELQKLLTLAAKGIGELVGEQKKILPESFSF